MILSDMIEDARRHLDASEKFFTGKEVCDRLFSAQQEIVRSILKEDPSFFVSTKTLTFDGSETYSLPLNARIGSRIIFAENKGSSDSSEIYPFTYDNYVTIESPSLINLTSDYHFMLEGDKVRITPTASSGSVKIWYVPTFGNMLQGRVDSASNSSPNTTLILNSTNPDYIYEFGDVDRRDDYYNGMSIQIIDGTGVGQTRKITDYNGSTRTVTVDSAWGTNPDNSGGGRSSYCIMCPVPEDFHTVVSARAALMMSVKNRNRQQELNQLYYGNPNERGMYYELMAWISNRIYSRDEVVQPTNFGF